MGGERSTVMGIKRLRELFFCCQIRIDTIISPLLDAKQMSLMCLFVMQIFGDLEAPSKDCFKMFNPIDLATFNVCISLEK